MPTIFSLLCLTCGLSLPEAAELLDVSLHTVKSWSKGARSCPEENLTKLHFLAKTLNAQADIISRRLRRTKSPIVLVDIEQVLKPAGAHHAMLGRIVALLPDETEYE